MICQLRMGVTNATTGAMEPHKFLRGMCKRHFKHLKKVAAGEISPTPPPPSPLVGTRQLANVVAFGGIGAVGGALCKEIDSERQGVNVRYMNSFLFQVLTFNALWFFCPYISVSLPHCIIKRPSAPEHIGR